jgi:chaperonin GroEL
MKQLIKNPDTQISMNEGVQKVADIVRCTLGPYGRNVAIMDTRAERSQPLLTDDGVRVVEFAISTLSDLELLGAKIVYTSSKKTEEDVGDGTTSTYLIAASVIDDYVKLVKDKKALNPVLVRKGVQDAKEIVLGYLKDVVNKDVTKDILINIAASSSGSKEIGNTVGELRYKLGQDGLVNIRMSRNSVDSVNYSNGYEFTGGFANQELFSNKPVDCIDPLVLIIDKMIMTTEDASILINAYAALIKKFGLTYDTPMVVLCNKLDGEALKVIYHNWFMRNDKVSIPIIPVEVPQTVDHAGTFEDLSMITGAAVVASQSSKLDVSELINSVGTAANIKTSKKMTYVVASDAPEAKEKIEKHISELKEEQAAMTDQAQGGEFANLAVRISKLNGIAVTIEVGGTTDIERTERKLKYDDAVLATHAAAKEGVVIGGGYTYYKAYYHIMSEYSVSIKLMEKEHPNEYIGFMLLINALRLPFELIPMNSGLLNYEELVQTAEHADPKRLEDIILYINLDTMKLEILDKKECKVYDPYLVAKSVLENAVSAISLFISTENSVLVEMK